MRATIAFSRDSKLWAEFPGAKARARAAVNASLRGAPKPAAPRVEIGVILSDDAQVRVLNAQWRGQDKATNVLSFPLPAGPATDGPTPLGDVVVAFETTRREAEAEGKSLADHFTHLVVHGTLHLLGYDHRTDGEANEMEALETLILMGLGVADPYAEPADEASA